MSTLSLGRQLPLWVFFFFLSSLALSVPALSLLPSFLLFLVAMDFLIGITGKDFVLLAADASYARSVVRMKDGKAPSSFLLRETVKKKRSTLPFTARARGMYGKTVELRGGMRHAATTLTPCRRLCSYVVVCSTDQDKMLQLSDHVISALSGPGKRRSILRSVLCSDRRKTLCIYKVITRDERTCS